MTATLLAHAGHLAPHGGTEAFTGVALLLIGAATALWWTRRGDTAQRDDNRRPSRYAPDVPKTINGGPPVTTVSVEPGLCHSRSPEANRHPRQNQ